MVGRQRDIEGEKCIDRTKEITGMSFEYLRIGQDGAICPYCCQVLGTLLTGLFSIMFFFLINGEGRLFCP